MVFWIIVIIVISIYFISKFKKKYQPISPMVKPYPQQISEKIVNETNQRNNNDQAKLKEDLLKKHFEKLQEKKSTYVDKEDNIFQSTITDTEIKSKPKAINVDSYSKDVLNDIEQNLNYKKNKIEPDSSIKIENKEYKIDSNYSNETSYSDEKSYANETSYSDEIKYNLYQSYGKKDNIEDSIIINTNISADVKIKSDNISLNRYEFNSFCSDIFKTDFYNYNRSDILIINKDIVRSDLINKFV